MTKFFSKVGQAPCRVIEEIEHTMHIFPIHSAYRFNDGSCQGLVYRRMTGLKRIAVTVVVELL